MTNRPPYLLAVALAAVFVVVAAAGLPITIFSAPSGGAATGGGFGPPPPPPGGPGVELRGWAWSSNIGWISMNCADGGACGTFPYGVTLDRGNGDMRGYAWSSSIGWIEFDPAGLYPSAPNRPAHIDLGTGAASGWARALSYNAPNGAWDGWIKMADASYGVRLSGTQFSGFAWGGDVVGWIGFDRVTLGGGGLPQPFCPVFSSDPSTLVVTKGSFGNSTISWRCVNVSSCSIDQGIGSVPVSGGTAAGSRNIQINKTTTFTISCTGGAGASAVTSVNITVFAPTRKEVRP